MSTKKKSMVKQMIDEALQKVDGSGFPDDPELNEDSRITGPERFAKGQKAKDEVLIDSQLADISTKEGYFLKLKKEMRPNEWMLMKTIESEWRNWPDVETAVANIVKEHTKTAPQKWGSGPYRIEYACKGGMRGKGYPFLDFYINAEEEFLNINGTTTGAVVGHAPVDATTQVTAQLDMLGRLTEIINSNKTPGLDVAQVQGQIAGAFEKGLTIKANEGSSSNQMMMTMMTGLMGMMTALATNKPAEPKVVNPQEGLTGMLETLKTFGVLGNSEKEKPKGLVETLGELKLLGIDLFKKDDPLEQVSKLKQIASIASDFMGMGGTSERPSIIEKIVDALAPALPGLMNDIKQTAQSAVQVQVEAGKNIERAKLNAPTSQPVVQPVHNEGTTMHQGTPAVNPQVQAFFNGLHEAVKANNRMFYPIVYTSLLQDPKGVELVNGIVSGSHTAKELVELLQGYGDARFKDSEFVMKHLVSYVNGFILWLRDMVKPKFYAEAAAEVPASNGFVAPKGPGVDVKCEICNTVFVYESVEEFEQEENKVCGNNGCTGMIQLMAKVS
jgi:hypothetical protein